jgi:hypothetical protein
MATATLQPRSPHTCTRRNRKCRTSTSVAPKEQVESMLREIAFVLHATRRISQEIRDAAETR